MEISRKKMYRTFIIILSAFAITTVILYVTQVSTSVPVAVTAEPSLKTVFDETGAEFEKMMLRDYAVIDKSNHTVAELKKLSGMLPSALGNTTELGQTEYSDEGYNGFSISGTTEQGYALDLVVQSRENPASTAVIAELWWDGGITDLTAALRYLDGCFEALGVKSNPAIVLAGEYSEILTVKSKKQVAKRCFKLFDAGISEKAEDGDYLSCSGYVPQLGKGKQSGDSEINLQVVLYDDETVGKTKIFVGYPVVFSDF